MLVDEKFAPEWFRDIEYIHWEGKTKDLSFIPDVEPSESLLVDDFHIYVHPGQEKLWVKIKQFDHPYSNSDRELGNTLNLLKSKM